MLENVPAEFTTNESPARTPAPLTCRPMDDSQLNRPEGFSLLEVLIAISLLAAALAILSQLGTVGRKQLDRALHKSVAARHGANKMARLVAGIEPLEEVETQPLLDDPDWDCRVELWPTMRPDLIEVTVSVRPAAESTSTDPNDQRAWFSYSRWLPYESPEFPGQAPVRESPEQAPDQRRLTADAAPQ